MFVKKWVFPTLRGKSPKGEDLLRIAQITRIFGVVPDFIVDEWIDEMLAGENPDEERLVQIASEHQVNPFTLKEIDEPPQGDWEATAEVLNEKTVLELLKGSW